MRVQVVHAPPVLGEGFTQDQAAEPTRGLEAVHTPDRAEVHTRVRVVARILAQGAGSIPAPVVALTPALVGVLIQVREAEHMPALVDPAAHRRGP